MTVWRKSSFSGGGDASGANCVEVATFPGDRIAFRDSKNPDGGMVVLARAGVTAWVRSINAGRTD